MQIRKKWPILLKKTKFAKNGLLQGSFLLVNPIKLLRSMFSKSLMWNAVFRIRVRRIRKFLGFSDP